MHQVSISPQWTIRREDGQTLSPRLLALLVQVHASGSLSAACRNTGASYRHSWDLVRQGEALFGAALLHMERGRGSRLTPLGEKLVWADRRITARLAPSLQSLASELEVGIRSVIEAESELLRVHASHGFAIERLIARLDGLNMVVDRKYVHSLQAVASLHDGGCDVAGFHVPIGSARSDALQVHRRWLDTDLLRVVPFVQRRQGLMVAAGNPLGIRELADLTRPDVRFINRQSGSGTRLLLDRLLMDAGVDRRDIVNYENGEYTHAAVAAYVASGMADVGFGVEPPARQFQLEFMPLADENYMLLCRQSSLERAPLRRALEVLGSAGFIAEINEIPGYRHVGNGGAVSLLDVFPELAGSGKAGSHEALAD